MNVQVAAISVITTAPTPLDHTCAAVIQAINLLNLVQVIIINSMKLVQELQVQELQAQATNALSNAMVS